MSIAMRATFACCLLFAGSASAQDDSAALLGPEELLQAGDAAYSARDWKTAADYFDTFLRHYEKAPEAAEAVAKIKPLLALARIRLKDFGAAGALVTECLALPKLDAALRDELAFWKGVILLQVSAHPEARQAFIDYFQTPEFQKQRRVESILLYGTTFLLENDNAQAAEFFEQQSSRLWAMDREAALRSQILRLNCLLETSDLAAAKEIIRAVQPLLNEVTQIISLHGLTAQLGGRFLEEGDAHSAIYCLQRVWASDRLLKHQENRIERLKTEIARLRMHKDAQAVVMQKQGVLTRIEREHRTFAANQSFDLGVRMRLGFAYLTMERFREAALVLEEALNLSGEPTQLAQAGMAVIQCWHQLERYDRALATAESWLIRFADKVDEEGVVKVKFLQGQANYDDQRFSDAASTFEELAADHPKHDKAAEALFMAGMARLMADEAAEAQTVFAAIQKQFGKLPVAEDASYWEGVAMSFQKEYETCREHLAAHLKRFDKSGRYAGSATFKRAYCLFALGVYEDAVEELRSYTESFPESSDVAEAQVLIGDALCSLGEIDDGLASYHEVAETEGHWFEEAQFKVGHVLKLRRDFEGMQQHFTAFMETRPHSRRLAEAVYWAGFALEAMDRSPEARELYWRAVLEHGANPAHHGVEEVLLALPRLYKGAGERLELMREAQRLRADSEKVKGRSLPCRLHWMEGHMQPEDRPRLAQADFMMAAALLEVKKQNPQVIADCADASREAGSPTRAGELYRELIRWHPRAVEVERAWAGLGFLAAEKGEWREALAQFEQFEKRAVSMDLRQKVKLTEAALLADHARTSEAIEIYESILGDKLMPPRAKAEALMAWAQLLEKRNDTLKATACYERVYLAYGRQRDLTAQAYLARGRALEKLGMKREASEVYTELVATDSLKEFPEIEEAQTRLMVIGPPPPGEPPMTTEVDS